jgi:integrase
MAKVSGTTEKSSVRSNSSKSQSGLYQSLYQSKPRTSKGEVAIEVYKGRLRLRWSHLGKRYCLSIGLPDGKINRLNAESKANQIARDIASDNFDPTLKKYAPKVAIGSSSHQISAVSLFERFTKTKTDLLAKATLAKYAAVVRYFKDYFNGTLASAIAVEDALVFTDWLKTKVEPITAKDRLSLIKACWEWAGSQNLVEHNPWKEAAKRFKVPPKQKAKPFTREEIGAIILGFRSDRYYRHYADYVEFLFGTGCRTGEAIGLKWKHLSHDCSTVWIGESLSRGVRKSTKTNRARTIALTPQLQAMLQKRRLEAGDPERLVFPSPTGKAISDGNFRKRGWNKILTRLEIDYRKPYTTRHTLVSHALDLGMNPVMVAQLTGHDVQVLYQNYAGNVNSRPRLPELLP